MRKTILSVLAALVVALGGVAAVAADPGADNPGSPGDNCSHGASGKACKDDPQPEHGKDCDDHGRARGNEDHCGPTETPTTPTDTTPTDTTPTDTTPTTPVDTTPTTPVDTTPVDTTPEDTTSTPTTPTVPESTPGPVTVPESAPSAPGSAVSPTHPKAKAPKAKAPKAKAPKAKAPSTKVVKVVRKKHGVVIITTADGRKHVGQMGSG